MEPREEVSKNIFSSNYQRAFQIAEENLREIPFEDTKNNTSRYLTAKELYLCSRFFYSRRERIQNKKDGIEKARMFVHFFEELEEYLLSEIPPKQISDSELIKEIHSYIHLVIAEGFAQEFAGQRSYNLDQKEILILVHSLLHLKNYKSAADVLYFMLQINSGNPTVNLLMGITSYYLEDRQNFARYFSTGLFIKPEVLEDYLNFLPEGDYKNLWNEVKDEEKGLRCRKYSILLEINGMLRYNGITSSSEAKKIELEYQTIKKEYEKNQNSNVYYKIIHMLLWLIRYYHEKNDYDQIDFFRSELKEYDAEIYSYFNEKNFQGK